MKDDIGDRIKSYYEDAFRNHLPMRLPVVLRLDGRGFSGYTKGLERPFSEPLIKAMDNVAIALLKEIQGSVLAYTQSDEISILIKNYSSIEQQAWFKNNIQKMVSVSAGIASSTMTVESLNVFGEIKPSVFDSRAMILPEFEINNYFIFRQNDCMRNSVQMLSRSLYSHKKCDNKKVHELVEMCKDKGIDWDNIPIHHQRGRCIVKSSYEAEDLDRRTGKIIKFQRSSWNADNNIPIFSKDKSYIENYFVKQ